MQPVVLGDRSTASILTPHRADHAPYRTERLPWGDQWFNREGTDRTYDGGRIEVGNPWETPTADAEPTIDRLFHAVPGLEGWVGIDGEGSVIDINPRLTTSYLGYRRLTDDNLAERLLFPERSFPPIRWNDATVRFSKAGTVDVTPREPRPLGSRFDRAAFSVPTP